MSDRLKIFISEKDKIHLEKFSKFIEYFINYLIRKKARFKKVAGEG